MHGQGSNCTPLALDARVLADGTQVFASGGSDGRVCVFNYGAGRQLTTLVHAKQVESVRFCSDTECLTATDGRVIRLWCFATAKVLALYRPHGNSPIKELAICKRGSTEYFLSAAWDRTVRLVELRSGCQVACLEGHGDWISSVDSIGDGTLAITASDDCSVRLWDLTLAVNSASATASTLIAAQELLAATNSTRESARGASAAEAMSALELADRENGENGDNGENGENGKETDSAPDTVQPVFALEREIVSTRFLSPDVFVTGSRDNVARVWQWQAAESGASDSQAVVSHVLSPAECGAWIVAMSAAPVSAPTDESKRGGTGSDLRCAWATADGDVHVTTLEAPAFHAVHAEHACHRRLTDKLEHLAFCYDDAHLCGASAAGMLRVFDSTDLQELGEYVMRRDDRNTGCERT